MKNLAAIILAAGQSTRMKSDLTKVMHRIAGRPVVSYVVDVAHDIGAKPICVVSSKGQPELTDYLKQRKIGVALQREARGTADAVIAAKSKLAGFSGYVVLLCGDIPLIQKDVIKKLIDNVRSTRATLGVLTMHMCDPARYGRIVRDLDGRITRIVEAKDAEGNEAEIREVNTGIFCVEREWLFRALSKVEPKNAQGEYYLTDIVSIAIAEGREVASHMVPEAQDFLGINTRVELARAAERMRERINQKHQLDGVGILDFRHTYIDADVIIGRDTEIAPHCFIQGHTKIGVRCTIENGVVLKDAIIGDDVHIKSYSVIEKSKVSNEAIIGPFSRVRPDSTIGRGARLGNFVEVKKSDLKAGVKANHLSYLGDATIGEDTNVGCGTITCNYDGKAKHRTVIGSHTFIGSDTQFIAPVKVGKGATIGAGSTITENVPADALAVARARQVNVKHWKKKRK
jgi:bifunctional UDP-N-acetylglucosamine pyrophosphorylase/glucosamine-1-phosphate N-acetyltransferase